MPIANRYDNLTEQRFPSLHFVYSPENELPGFTDIMDEIIGVMSIYYPFLSMAYEIGQADYGQDGVNSIQWKNDIEMDLLTGGSAGFVKIRPDGERDILLNHDTIKTYSKARDAFFHEANHAFGLGHCNIENALMYVNSLGVKGNRISPFITCQAVLSEMYGTKDLNTEPYLATRGRNRGCIYIPVFMLEDTPYTATLSYGGVEDGKQVWTLEHWQKLSGTVPEPQAYFDDWQDFTFSHTAASENGILLLRDVNSINVKYEWIQMEFISGKFYLIGFKKY